LLLRHLRSSGRRADNRRQLSAGVLPAARQKPPQPDAAWRNGCTCDMGAPLEQKERPFKALLDDVGSAIEI